MSAEAREVWTTTHSLETQAPPEALWRLMADVTTWPRWNAGVARIDLDGPFASGSTFRMTLPDGDVLTSLLKDVRPGVGFVDETVLGGLVIAVDHTLTPLPGGNTRVAYAVRAQGPDCEAAGRAVSADFPDVLRALAAQALAGR